MSTGALRLLWKTRGGPAATFVVRLHSAISGRPLQTIVEQIGPGEGTAFIEDEPRVSYLVIESLDALEWTAALEEAVPAHSLRR